uniref:Uncharacterized protein n=1 Tax=Hucho hucho TaxID=62062 RepID=A0A4W5KJ23_9TELE
MNKRLLDPANTMQFDDFKKCYGEILHRWGLKEKRAEVLKCTSCPAEPHKGIGEEGAPFKPNSVIYPSDREEGLRSTPTL